MVCGRAVAFLSFSFIIFRMLELKLEKRDKTGKGARDGQSGRMPAVFYGRKEISTPVSVFEKDFEKVWKEAGESSVISLTGLGESKEALIQEVDVDPVTGKPRHVDFYILEKGRKVEVSVPLVFEGTPSAVKELGGTLVKVLHELEVEAMPKDLPHEIKVDVASLTDFEKRIFVRDIVLPEGVTALVEPDEVVALVSEVEEEPVEEVVAPDLTEIEVEKKGKKEEEGEVEGGAPAPETKAKK